MSFPQFTQLQEELMISVLAFVADSPFENPHERSCLTHVLPLVSRNFYHLSQSDYMWKSCLERMVTKEPDLWKEGLFRLLPSDLLRSSLEQEGEKNIPANLVEAVHDSFPEPRLGYQDMFKRIVAEYLRFTGPVFIMSGSISVGQPFGLHFFEPRYRVLIEEVMAPFPEEYRNGAYVEQHNGEFPTFVYAHVHPFAPTSPACLVQVRRCHIHRDGTADVLLVPSAYVWLERIWERPNSGHLFYAQCLKMGRDASRQMEEQQFRVSEEERVTEAFNAMGENHGGMIAQLLRGMLMRHGEHEFDDQEEEDSDMEDNEVRVD